MVVNPIGLEHDGFGYMRRRDVERQLRTLPESVLKNRIISGHLPFGFEDPLGLRFSYVSFFRSPVERILSGFMYGSQDQLKPNKEWLKFALHLSVSNGGVGFDNAVTRLLTGGEALIPSSSKATIWDLPRVTMADRALAIERLKRRFGFVGLTERFEDSCEILFGLLGKPYQRSDLRLNETPLDLEISEVPPGTLYLLEQRLAHDIAVYAAACDRYNEFASAHHFPLADPFENRPRRRARSPAGIMRIWLMLRVRSGHRPMTSGSHVRSIGRGAGSSSGITLPSRITVGR